MMKTVTVSSDALRKVLDALNSPGHYIRELQATRGPLVGDDNPINVLCTEFNAAINVHNELARVAAEIGKVMP
jgi:hypothetical protein